MPDTWSTKTISMIYSEHLRGFVTIYWFFFCVCFQTPPVIASLWSPERDIISKRKMAVIGRPWEKAVSLLQMNKPGWTEMKNRIPSAAAPPREQLAQRNTRKGSFNRRMSHSEFWLYCGWRPLSKWLLSLRFLLYLRCDCSFSQGGGSYSNISSLPLCSTAAED